MEGETIANVSYASGVGEGTLSKWRKVERKRLGLSRSPRPQYSAEFRAACAERLLEGETLAALSEETGVKPDTLKQWRVDARNAREDSSILSAMR